MSNKILLDVVAGLLNVHGVIIGSSLVAQKEKICLNARDPGSIPGSGRSPGGRNGNSFQYVWRIPWTEEPGGL